MLFVCVVFFDVFMVVVLLFCVVVCVCCGGVVCLRLRLCVIYGLRMK